MSDEREATGERVSPRGLALLFGLSFLAYLPGLLLGPPGPKGMGGGLQILHGAVPYRDFWSMYAPGQFYAHAALFALFGVKWLPQAIVTLLLRAGSAVLFLRVLERLGAPRRLALVLFGVFTLAFFRVGPDLASYPPALFLVLVALERVLAVVRGGAGSGAILVAGLTLGLAASFKHDVAAYFALGCTAALLVGANERRGVRDVLVLALGCAITALPVVAFLAVEAGEHAWRDLVVFPATDFRAVRYDGYPGFLPDAAPFEAALASPTDILALRDAGQALRGWALTQLPIVAFVTALVVVAALWRMLAPATRASALALLPGMPLFFLAAHVQQNTHVDSMAILSLLLAALAWGSVHAARPLLLVGIVLYAGAFLLEAGMRYGELATQWSGSRTIDVPAAGPIRLPERYVEAYGGVARFVRANVPSGERIHAGVDRHDAIVGNDQNFYVLTERLPATKHAELHPGIVDREDVQREMIADLERHGVRCVLRWYFRFGDPEVRKARRAEKLPGVGLGSTLLDDWIAENFEPVAKFGQHEVLWRRGSDRPWERAAGSDQDAPAGSGAGD